MDPPKPEIPKETPPPDPMAEMRGKLDSLEKMLTQLLPKEDTTPKVDPVIVAAENALRDVIGDALPKEDVLKMTLPELTLAVKLKKNMKPGLPDPPQAKPKSDSTDPNASLLGYYSRMEAK